MKRFVSNTVLLLSLGVSICDFHSIVGFFYNDFMIEKRLMWGDRIDLQKYDGVSTIYNYMWEIENIVALIVWFFAFARVANLVSHKLFRVILVFCAYFATQLFFYVWDRNTVFFSNIIVYIYMTIAIGISLFPTKKGGKLINLEDYPD